MYTKKKIRRTQSRTIYIFNLEITYRSSVNLRIAWIAAHAFSRYYIYFIEYERNELSRTPTILETLCWWVSRRKGSLFRKD